MLDSVTLETLARLTEAVINRSITQSTISDVTGVHQSQVSRILSGQAKRYSKNVNRLCNFYNMHISDARASPPIKVPIDIQSTLVSLLTGKKETDAALNDMLDSIAKWRNSMKISHG